MSRTISVYVYDKVPTGESESNYHRLHVGLVKRGSPHEEIIQQFARDKTLPEGVRLEYRYSTDPMA